MYIIYPYECVCVCVFVNYTLYLLFINHSLSNDMWYDHTFSCTLFARHSRYLKLSLVKYVTGLAGKKFTNNRNSDAHIYRPIRVLHVTHAIYHPGFRCFFNIQSPNDVTFGNFSSAFYVIHFNPALSEFQCIYIYILAIGR